MGELAFIQENIEAIGLYVVLGIAVLGVVLALGYPFFRRWIESAERRRTEGMRRLAVEMGMCFSSRQSVGFGYHDVFQGFSCFQKGANGSAYNVIGGRPGKVMLFDFHYEVESNSGNYHCDFSAVIVESDFRLLPLSIRPERGVDKLAPALGGEDIDFESAEFSRRFRVQALDRRWACDVIHGRVMEILLETNGISVECSRRFMICYRPDRRFKKREFAAALKLVREILGRIPEHAKERARARP